MVSSKGTSGFIPTFLTEQQQVVYLTICDKIRAEGLSLLACGLARPANSSEHLLCDVLDSWPEGLVFLFAAAKRAEIAISPMWLLFLDWIEMGGTSQCP